MRAGMWLVCSAALFLGFLFSATTRAEQELRVVTELSAPLQTLENNQVSGIATDIIREIATRAGYTPRIDLLPWARAYQTALQEKNTAIYSIAKSEERSELFHWIGPIVPVQFGLYRLKARDDIVVNDLQDISKYRVGVLNNDVRHRYLRGLGFRDAPEGNLQIVSEQGLNYRKLYSDRVDLIVMGFMTCVTRVIRCEDLQRVWVLDELSEGLYFSLRKGSDPALVQALEKSFNAMRSNGRLQDLQKPLKLDVSIAANTIKK